MRRAAAVQALFRCGESDLRVTVDSSAAHLMVRDIRAPSVPEGIEWKIG